MRICLVARAGLEPCTLCYADDICLISLSSAGMQHLLNMCDTYAKGYDLLYNGSKSYSLF